MKLEEKYGNLPEKSMTFRAPNVRSGTNSIRERN